jgi:hypothetical protein
MRLLLLALQVLLGAGAIVAAISLVRGRVAARPATMAVPVASVVLSDVKVGGCLCLFLGALPSIPVWQRLPWLLL